VSRSRGPTTHTLGRPLFVTVSLTQAWCEGNAGLCDVEPCKMCTRLTGCMCLLLLLLLLL
jgi:hypothetical protein